jgi:CDP-glycerol glycerophosphotransferase
VRAWWFRLPGTTRLARVTALARRDALLPGVAWVGGRLPSRRIAVFDADAGRAFDGNVRALSDGLSTARPDLARVWVHRASPLRVPPTTQAVERLSLRAAWLLSRASVLVVDGSAAPVTEPGPRVLVVNAGSGVPFHRIGLDDPSVLVSRAAVASVRRRSRRWNLLLAPSAESAGILQGALGYRGHAEAVGLPRIDALVGERRSASEGLRRRLDLPTERAVLLWAPAHRPAGSPDTLLDLDAWAAAVGERAYLLVRDPPGDGATVPTRLRFSVRQLAQDEDRLPFLAASDLLISDYSSVVGDAAALDIPVVLYQPDRTEYVGRTRGLYPWADEAGPIVTTETGLLDEVRSWLDDARAWDAAHAGARRAWAARAAGPADGAATQRAIDAVLAGLERR